eukprot:gene304-549_t
MLGRTNHRKSKRKLQSESNCTNANDTRPNPNSESHDLRLDLGQFIPKSPTTVKVVNEGTTIGLDLFPVQNYLGRFPSIPVTSRNSIDNEKCEVEAECIGPVGEKGIEVIITNPLVTTVAQVMHHQINPNIISYENGSGSMLTAGGEHTSTSPQVLPKAMSSGMGLGMGVLPSAPVPGENAVDTVVYPSPKSPHVSLMFASPLGTDAKKKTTRSLGTWKFDKTKRKKYYVSLTGQRFEGSQAVRKCGEDQMYVLNPSLSERPELRHIRTLSSLTGGSDVVVKLGNAQSNRQTLRDCRDKNTVPLADPMSAREPGTLSEGAPTSGGKTMVAEILMLRSLALKGYGHGHGMVLFVVPFVSLAEEKAAYFQDMWAELHVGVKAMHGEDGGLVLSDDIDIIVCTIERANVIVTQLLEERTEDKISLVVVDEIHLIGDSSRGFLLEVMLSKLKFTSSSSIQIVAMSATLPNMQDIADWLGASLYMTEYRPVDLVTRVCCDRKIHRVVECNKTSTSTGNNLSHDLIPCTDEGEGCIEDIPDDPDGLLGLLLETFRKGKGVLVFCPSKRRCEAVSELVAAYLTKQLHDNTTTTSDGNEDIRHLRFRILGELRQTPVGLCPSLRRTVPLGVAYHHAGLTVDERKILENAFRSGTLKLLVATSTLAAGVNLPAHRVIIRSPQMGQDDLSVANFKQMCGRAGRMLLDSQGEAILMIDNNLCQRRLAVRLCVDPIEPLQSTLHAASGGGFEKLLLEMICCRRLTRRDQVFTFASCSLLSVQRSQSEIECWVQRALSFLVDNQFIIETAEVSPNGGDNDVYATVATPLGRATALSGIAPRDALPVLSSLQRARVNLVLRSNFHPVFLCTPPSPCLEPNWTRYELMIDALLSDYPTHLTSSVFVSCRQEVRGVVEVLGADFGELCRLKMNPPKYGCDKPRTCFYRRLYAAVIVFSLVQEVPLNRVAKLLDIKRGQLQQLQKDAAAFCGMAVIFCKILNWESLACVLQSYSSRLCCGVKPELLPLVRLGAEMPAFRARAFFRSGLCDASAIVKADADFMVQILLDSMPFSGKDPLVARDAATIRSGDGDDNGDRSSKVRDRSRNGNGDESLRVCVALAKQIRSRAKESVQEELLAVLREAKY